MIKTSYVSRTIAELKPSGIRRFFDLVANLEGVVSLGVGEPDFVTSWAVREANLSTHWRKDIPHIQLMPDYLN